MASVATDGGGILLDGLQKHEDKRNDGGFNVAESFESNLEQAAIKQSVKTTVSGRSYHMIDVRCRDARITPKEELLRNFVQVPEVHHLGPEASHSILQADGSVAHVDHAKATRRLPTEILYDKDGLALFDDITCMESNEYYLTACEENIFQNQMDQLIPFIPDGAAIFELGCGSMAKTAIFLDAVRKAGKKNICFYAIDIEQTSLENSIEDLIEYEERQDEKTNMLQYSGILGSYDQALESGFINDVACPKIFLWLGSSIGNWTRNDATEFLRNFSDKVMQPFDLFMIGIDQRNDPLTIARAYNDSAGITKEFGLNGLRHLNKLLGHEVFDDTNFDYFAGYNVTEGRHEAYFRSQKDQILHIPAEASESNAPTTVHLQKDELINYEFSYKYSVGEIHELCDQARFHLSELLYDSSKLYTFAVLSKAAFNPVPRAKMGRGMFPHLDEFEQVWKLWHTLTSPSIIRNPLEKPIDLRHPLIFYVGHIPAFEDIYQSRHFGIPLTEPARFAEIFERGINPVVEDPTKCHAHSEVPDEWPSIDTVRKYDAQVHERIRHIYKLFEAPAGVTVESGMQRLGRQLAISLEHTIMHAETYIYMLVQLKRVLLPKSFMPGYLRSASHKTKAIKGASWVNIQSGIVKKGIANHERDDDKFGSPIENDFGWDNETPVRTYEVKDAFQAQSRPVTCGEYLEFLSTIGDAEQKNQLVPASWMETSNGDYALLTVFGPIEISRVQNTPVSLSYKLAEKYRDYIRTVNNDPSVRMPTEEEWVVMQSQLKGNNCHEDVDFMNWMPAPLPENSHHTIGSVWEWTSTVFDSHEGFEQSKMYPGYSVDFFDGLHNVVRGASWCTHGRITNRLRNFYQRSYPYAFIGVRFVRNTSQ